MIEIVRETLWKQFGASIDMVENSILLWPEEEWSTDKNFFYISFHTLAFLDYYLSMPPEAYTPTLPFVIMERSNRPPEAVGDVVPERIYTKKELLDYLHSCREKCEAIIKGLTAEKLQERWIEQGGEMDYPHLEILLYNMRHVQHHAGQMNMLLRNKIDAAPGWVARARNYHS